MEQKLQKTGLLGSLPSDPGPRFALDVVNWRQVTICRGDLSDRISYLAALMSWNHNPNCRGLVDRRRLHTGPCYSIAKGSQAQDAPCGMHVNQSHETMAVNRNLPQCPKAA